MTSPKVAAIVLAAGKSSRMGDAHKLLETLEGRPIVTWAVGSALASGAALVVVVTGHRADAVEAVIE